MLSRRLDARFSGLLVVSFFALVLAFAGGGGAATSSRALATGATFTDPVGDASGGAPDITTVSVSDDGSTGRITIAVTAAGFAAAPAEKYPEALVFMDTDKNPSTGDGANIGADYRLIVERQPGGGGIWNLKHWSGGAWVMAPTAADDGASSSGDVVTWRINKSGLGGPTGFFFVAASAVYDGNSQSGGDLAPNSGKWSYDLGSAPPPPPPNLAPVARLAVTPGSALVGATVSFDGSASSDGDGRIVSWSWSFGDGQTAAGSMARHAYATAGTYVVTLVVTDDDGATASATQSVVVTAPNVAPVARLAVTPASTAVGKAVLFDGSASSDGDGRIVSYAWTFGDGATGVGSTARHAYTVAGTYRVTLLVTDDDGATGSAAQSIRVNVPAASKARLKAVIGVPTTSPGKAVAGKQFTVTFPVRRSDNGALLRTGRMICAPSVTGKVIRHSERFANGKARLSFLIPKSAKGKLLKVKVTIKVGTKSTTKVASFRVTGPSSAGARANQAPAWPKITFSTRTDYRYDPAGALVGAVTTIEISPAVDPNGDALSYKWTATNGSIVGHGLSATWTRQVVAGTIRSGDAVVTADDGHGGTARHTFMFR